MISDKINDGLRGKTNIPGDKSISHRSIIIPSISKGICEINNLLKSDDVMHTMNAFKAMGVIKRLFRRDVANPSIEQVGLQVRSQR